MLSFTTVMRVGMVTSALLGLGSAAPASNLKLSSRSPSFDYDSQKVAGVNLGGWL